MKLRNTKRKKIAIMLLILTVTNVLLPEVCLALTSGPTQPEVASFQPAGVSDMVDLFTGDFKYNIPLLDVDGYPVNLNYASGTGMDDEASWVGLGWNVNVGAINRQVRGIPDDMAGDIVQTNHYTKPKITVGGRITGKIENVGRGNSTTKKTKLSGSLSIGIFNDNYTGIGAEVGANAGISAINEGPYTASLGLGITSSTQAGADMTPTISLGIKASMDEKTTVNAGLSASLGYNSRSGLKNLTLGSSFDISKELKSIVDNCKHSSFQSLKTGGEASGTAISFNTQPILPNIQIPYRTRYGSFSIDIGGSLQSIFIGGGGTGYKNVREVASPKLTNPAFGFLYAERGKNQKNALMDFIRDNDNPVIPELPNLAVPVPTPDIFTFDSQLGSGQFRLYRGGSGAYFDNEVTDDEKSTTLGGDIGLGYLFHAGVTFFQQNTQNVTRKWTGNNNYLSKGDFQDISFTNPNAQNAYFKVVGEKTLEDAVMASQVHDVQPLEVSINGKTANAKFTNNSLTKLQKQNRAVNQTVISYLTAQEASVAGLDRQINSYPMYNDTSGFEPPSNNLPSPVSTSPRFDNNYHQKHHLSEISITSPDGKRMVYGLPIYNAKQTEYSFAIGSKVDSEYAILPGTNNTVRLAIDSSNAASPLINHKKGIDNYYHAQTQPAYATSFLLTGVLSPDYVDRTGDGISSDDPGTAIKFNYAKLPHLFKWRSPFHGATLNRSMLADKDDDKASIVYGEKEIWYISSIESKTKVAYFITEDRDDALGVTDFTGVYADTTNRQRCLKEIRLYSKADMTKPIKVVKFEYTYELCRGVPNNIYNINGQSGDALRGGKLTLKKVYFEYGNSPKGTNYPYEFTYQNSVNGSPVGYGDMETDRWGTFKSSAENLLPLKNDEFPYTNQDVQGNDASVKARADQNVALWHLSGIRLPTGGFINVNYESDDYAYVQNKRAMVMSGVSALIDGNGSDLPDSLSVSYLKDAKGFKIKVPNAPTSVDEPTAWFKQNYLNGADYIYTKFFVKVSTPESVSGGEGYDYDFVPCYAKIKSVSFSDGYARILLEDRTDAGVTANPIIFSAWQKMKDEYPRYAYPGFDRRNNDAKANSAVADAVKAVFSAIGNLSELTEKFYHKAKRKKYAAKIHLDRCFVKVVKQDGRKLGGGLRVKKIQISDSWQTMSGNSNAISASYGQAYDYTMVDNGLTMSSGVAAYEPSVGNDENPLKQPVTYVQKVKGAVDNFFDLEEPFGESFFPAPSVGYSKVTVTDLNKDGVPDPALRTGYIVNEFYTAREFPVQVTVVPISENENKPFNKYSFLGATSVDELTMSQGYGIVLNDMHGKMKATRVLNQSGAEIASTVYYYNADAKGTDGSQLRNTVSIVNPDGSISSNQVIGRDIDFFTDFREFETRNSGRSIDLGFDMIGLAFVTFPLPHFPTYGNSEYKLFRSACAVKVSQYYGLIDKVVKTENGSSITTTNLAYDGLTGEPIVTSTQNEFNNTIYSVNLPAYWVYKGMGPAYQNSGILLKNFSTDANGKFINYNSFVKAGDEFVDLGSGLKYWVIENRTAMEGSPTKKLITAGGNLAASFTATGLVKLVRSGYRNLLGAKAESLVCLNNPIQGNQLKIVASNDLTGLKVINASASTYNQSWAVSTVNNPATDSSRVENKAYNFTFGKATSNVNYGSMGVVIYDTTGAKTTNQNYYLKGGMDRAGIWLNPVSDLQLGQRLGFETDINIATAGTYYVGYSGDDLYQYTVDNVQLPSDSGNTWWSVYPLHLSKGPHHLSLAATNVAQPDNNHNNVADNPGAIAMEIYNCSLSDLANGSNLPTIFSTTQIVNDPAVQSFRTVNGVQVYHFEAGYINPYTAGFLGNWRERSSQVFQQSRYTNPNTPDHGLNIRSSGFINHFSAYWYYGTHANGQPGWKTDQVGNRSRWVTANTVTAYDKYGQQLENKDALGRFSAAKFDFNGELPGGVASNAMNREIYVSGFEDQYFIPGTGSGTVSNDFVQLSTGHALKQFIVHTTSHSGNYSLQLPSDGLTLTTKLHTQMLGIDNLLSIDNIGRFNTLTGVGLYPNGFEPQPYKKYVFDTWVSDGSPGDKSIKLTLTVNGAPVTLICKANVEGWKLLEGTMDFSNTGPGALSIAVAPVNGSTVYVDDIRMHPFDAQLKSYAYDDKTMRLMAELDENCFATFYEYDDEGLLIRVKKETERGVMTIKESRSSYRKNTGL